jgi:hypothetical protein
MSQQATGEAMNSFNSQAFRDEFEGTLEKKLDNKLKPIIETLDDKFQQILDMKSTVIKHDRWIERQKGVFATALWVVSGVGAFLLVIVGYILSAHGRFN